MIDDSPWAQLAGKLDQDKPVFARVFYADEADRPASPDRLPEIVSRALGLVPYAWEQLGSEATPFPFLGGTTEGIASADLVIFCVGAVCIPREAEGVEPVIRQLHDLAVHAQRARPWQGGRGCTLFVAPPSGDPSLPRWQYTHALIEGIGGLAADFGHPFANPQQELFWRIIAGDTRERYFESPEKPLLSPTGVELWAAVIGETIHAALDPGYTPEG